MTKADAAWEREGKGEHQLRRWGQNCGKKSQSSASEQSFLHRPPPAPELAGAELPALAGAGARWEEGSPLVMQEDRNKIKVTFGNALL